MADYIGDIGDFNPNESYRGNNPYYDWDFEEREKREGELTSRLTLNLIKKHPK